MANVMNVVLQIEELASGALTLIPLGLQLASKIKSALEVDPDYKASIKYLTDDAIAADDAAVNAIEAADPAAAPDGAGLQPPPPEPATTG